MSNAWSEAEVRRTVEDYFDMLRRELKGERYVKAEHNRRLAESLDSRSKGSVEFKHENISAVLLEMELPYIDGYKPRHNYQGLLAAVVREHVERHGAELEALASAEESREPAKPPALPDWSGVLVEPPELLPQAAEPRPANPVARKFDFPARDARNRKLGTLGEEFVVQFETARLEQAGMKDLARRVEWVAKKDDTAGFDVLSFGDGGRERLIEVKTTNYGRSFPFLISRNEAEMSARRSDDWCIYRVFTFRAAPRLFVLPGDVSRRCHLEPTAYRASFGRVA